MQEKNEYLSQVIVPCLVTGLGIGLVILVGMIVLKNVSIEQAWLEGFCIDKDTGVYDIREYNISTKMLQHSYVNVTCILGKPLYQIETVS